MTYGDCIVASRGDPANGSHGLWRQHDFMSHEGVLINRTEDVASCDVHTGTQGGVGLVLPDDFAVETGGANALWTVD